MRNCLEFKIISVTLILIIVSFLSYSQTNPIPNYSFENWSGNNPTGWSTSNSDWQGSVTQSSDAQDGGSSVKFSQVNDDDNCDQINALITVSFPINKRYSTFRYFIKVQNNLGSKCFGGGGGLELYKNGSLIGQAGEEANPPEIEGVGWAERTFNIWYDPLYNDSEIPDSAVIELGLWDTTMNSPNYVLIDNVSLFGGNQLIITRPGGGEKWIAGTKDSIKWNDGAVGDTVALFYSDDDGSSTHIIDTNIPADTGRYDWDIPKDILSTKCRIYIKSHKDLNVADTTGLFKIKGYVLTRIDGNGDYVAYDKTKDRWGFSNRPEQMWPITWWPRFNYRGIDPFTGVQYSQWQGFFVFAYAYPTDFPDWEAFVRAFSESACYISTTLGIYSPTALSRWGAVKGPWGGSCFGIAAANALAFTYRNNFANKFSSFPNIVNPITIMSDSNVIPVISELFSNQFGNPSKVNDNTNGGKTVNQTLNDLRQMLIEDEVQPKTISIFRGNPPWGAHTILAYKLRRDPTQNNIYYVDVYDNSNPTSNNPITIDTTLHSNNGGWSTPDWAGWSGKFYLEILSNQYLNGATFPKRQNPQSQFILAENELEINYPLGSQIEIRDLQGNLTGFVNNQVYEEIPGSIARMIKNGSEGPPYGYSLTTDNYSVHIDGVESDTLETFFFTGNKTFTYERNGVNSAETDRLFFDGGVSVTNPDQDDKSISLINIINESSQEKLFALRNISLIHNDSVKIENPDDNRLNFISYGSEKTYGVELNFATELGLGRFVNNSIAITQNTTHQLVPNWGDFAELGLTIYVDKDNDGTIEDTLHLNNTVDVEDQGSNNIPAEYKLEQNYPNPFNPTTTIRYSIPKAGIVNLKVYNLIGEEITTLVNEDKAAGNYEVEFDASQLPSGVYLYQLNAADFVETKKMVLLK